MAIQPESSYVGRHAQLYDLFYADKNYQQEAGFVHDCIQTYNPRTRNILELACGTGSHSFFLEKLGYNLISTDYSPDMLARAKEKARKMNSSIDFRQQDMRVLDIPERPFDAIICLFDSIGYVATNQNLLKVLSGVNRHLTFDGLFIFEFWHAAAMLRSYDPVRVRRFNTPDGTIERISETSIDYKEQLCRVSYTIHEMRLDGTCNTFSETQINRFFLLQEMNLFLRQAMLYPVKWCAGFRNDEEVNDTVWHIVVVARKTTGVADESRVISS